MVVAGRRAGSAAVDAADLADGATRVAAVAVQAAARRRFVTLAEGVAANVWTFPGAVREIGVVAGTVTASVAAFGRAIADVIAVADPVIAGVAALDRASAP